MLGEVASVKSWSGEVLRLWLCARAEGLAVCPVMLGGGMLESGKLLVLAVLSSNLVLLLFVAKSLSYGPEPASALP